MSISELLWACRRRWRLIVVLVALALAIAWLTTPTSSSVSRRKQQDISYRAVTTMVSDSSPKTLGRLVLLATAGDVPDSVRKALHEPAGNSNDVTINKATGARRTNIGSTIVTAMPDADSGAIRIQTDDDSAKRAAAVSNALSLRLIQKANTEAIAAYQSEYDLLDKARVGLQRQEEQLNNQLNVALATRSADVGTIDAKHQAVLRELSDLQQRILRLENNRPQGPPLQILQAAAPVRQVQSHGLATPTDPISRLLLGAL